MKRRRSPCPSPHGDRDTEKLSFSRSEVEKMIDEAVLSAGIAREERYEYALYKLEEDIMMIKRRGNAAFAYIKKLGISSAPVNKQDQSQLQSPAVAVKMDRYEDGTMKMELHDKTDRKSIEDKGEFLKTMENRKRTMQADTKAMTIIIQKLKKEPLSPTRQSTLPSTSHSLQSNVGPSSGWIKKESMSPGHSPNHEKMQVDDEEPEPLWTQVQQHSVDGNYPPFPDTPFPLVLNWEAASYNIPQAPTIQAAIINNPPGLNIYWSIEEKDALTINSYSVLRTVEDAKGSSIFKEWEKVAEVEARDVPMYLSQSKLLPCRPDFKVGFTVVGKDKFGRYGPHSNIISETHPAP